MSEDLRELTRDAERYTDQLPRSSSRDEALELAIKAAETSMRALKLAQDPNEKARHSARFKQLLQEAERIKTSKDWRQRQSAMPDGSEPSSHVNAVSQTAVSTRVLPEPISQRTLPKSEQILLLKAGYLNGFKFPPWTNPPTPGEFELRDGEALYLYVVLISTRHCLPPALTVSSTETSLSCPSLSSKKTCWRVGSGLQRRCHPQRGFQVIV